MMFKLTLVGAATALLCAGGLIWYSALLESQPQVQAARASLEILNAQGQEYDRLAERAHQLRMRAYELKFGPAAKLRLEREELMLGIYRDPR